MPQNIDIYTSKQKVFNGTKRNSNFLEQLKNMHLCFIMSFISMGIKITLLSDRLKVEPLPLVEFLRFSPIPLNCICPEQKLYHV